MTAHPMHFPCQIFEDQKFIDKLALEKHILSTRAHPIKFTPTTLRNKNHPHPSRKPRDSYPGVPLRMRRIKTHSRRTDESTSPVGVTFGTSPQLLFRKLPSLTESEKFFSHVSIQTGIAGQSSHKRLIGNTLKEACCKIRIAGPTSRKIPAMMRYSRRPLGTGCAAVGCPNAVLLIRSCFRAGGLNSKSTDIAFRLPTFKAFPL
jgi:hypothetical protein